ncbi:ATPase component of general energizing module of ECF transporters [Listeria monocytogenes]|jgi:ABC-type cobalt transport system, ATPase component|uniref:Energy-coupling factor transporter ATP-binding protein EcfA1 n=5 Tax=Listeria monocytogenes TaxID=1639 RepID=A0AB37NA60_LISMN|nr:energy-coupling factor ABC transporter ATP-binding protein [Listeria monocytogenes]AEO07583.1 cobalt import ATP-binding protein cbiO 2 [Listeria monocytogenes 10403S]AEO26944.1 cobalt ABC transporter [Listeria monocytogenes FSL R2-561]AEO40067.1 cobalt ABC transporter [Listeria monocytogenes Finland 1998]EEW14784.1 cobalt ABC transporter [Listeria monocytogenes FSL N3-165]EXL16263.1 Energy-coupling factor transporter ATP-binding protein EcfA 2 [Listeria monocytogenes Lm_1840]EXL23621.1 Ene
MDVYTIINNEWSKSEVLSVAESFVRLEHVFYKYEDTEKYAVKDVSISAQKGEWVALVGHNGSGKSTIAKLLNGLLFPEDGLIKIGHFVLSEKNIWEIRRQVGMVFQNPDNQFVGATVQDDVAFGLENHGVPHDTMVERVESALNEVGMQSYALHEPARLSGGQKQRVAIAGVLALQPDVIILDEATSMLDPRGRAEVMETIRIMREQEDITVISITHDLDEVLFADRVIVMNKGEIHSEGTPKEIFQQADAMREIGLGVPFIIELQEKLVAGGFETGSTVLSEGALLDQLWKLNSNN